MNKGNSLGTPKWGIPRITNARERNILIFVLVFPLCSYCTLGLPALAPPHFGPFNKGITAQGFSSHLHSTS